MIYWQVIDIFALNITPLAVLFGLGFAVSIINGMIYKIIPFLTWFHLNSQGVFNIPTMRDMIPSQATKIQFYLHISSVVLFFIGLLIVIIYLKFKVLIIY